MLIKLVIPEIMIPLVSTAAEIQILRNLVDKTATKIQKIHSIFELNMFCEKTFFL